MNKYRVVSRTFLYSLSCFIGVIAMVYARSLDGGPILSWVTLLAAAMGIIIGALVARLAIWMLRLPPRDNKDT